MKAKYKLIIITLIMLSLLFFTKLPIAKRYILHAIDSKATVTPVTHENQNKPTAEELKQQYLEELISKNTDSEYDYVIRYLSNGGKLDKAKELVEMLQAVKDGKIPYENYIDEINLDGRYDVVIDSLEENGDEEAAKKLVHEIDKGKYAGEVNSYQKYLSKINKNHKYDYVINYLNNGGDENVAIKMVNNIRAGKSPEIQYKEYLESLNKDGKYNEVLKFLNNGGSESEAKNMVLKMEGYNYSESREPDFAVYNDKSYFKMGLMEPDTYGNVLKNQPYVIDRNLSGRGDPRMYTLWADSHPEMMPEWIAYCAKHGLAILTPPFKKVTQEELNSLREDKHQKRKDIVVPERTLTFNRYGDPYDHIPQDVSYAMTYQGKMMLEGLSESVLAQIQQTIWNSLTWTNKYNEPKNTSVS